MKPTAAKTETTFRMECAVSVQINARHERIWDLLTNADDMPRWNSTVTSVRGPIALGTKLELRVPLAPERVFRPKVTALDTGAHRMVWSDGAAPMFKGVRTYTLTPRSDGTTEFSMVEVFRGLMLPMIKRSLPDFAPAFAAYAEDLKREAEKAA
jgi:hypothetical protein